MRLLLILSLFTVGISSLFSQVLTIKGSVYDAATGETLPAATVLLFPENQFVQTNSGGGFEFRTLAPREYHIRVQFVGFEDYTGTFRLTADTVLNVALQPQVHQLQELEVKVFMHGKVQLITTSVQEIGRAYLLQNNAANFAQTLASLPGVASMDIGAGFSKPVIRGMAFNRVAVVDKGIVQQNQQWGADHGLEIDQYDVDGVRVYKGPQSLLYGSDAMGGVIEIFPATVPQTDMFWGDATFVAKSNNDLWGTSVVLSAKRGAWFVRGRFTAQEYGDYRVPTDTIVYLSWKLPVHNRRMKNTAGQEYNASLSANFDNGCVNSWLHASSIYGKNGFYPGAHGIPSLVRLQPDGLARNAEFPFSFSNHFKLINNTVVRFSDYKLLIDAAFQQNRREEHSLFHTHYGSQKPPAVQPNLELAFRLHTFSLNAHVEWHENRNWMKTVGLSSEYQHNRVGGYSFLLPAFNRFSGGIYWLNTLKLNDAFSLAGGIRYDMGRINVTGMYDTVLHDYLLEQNYAANEAEAYARRAENMYKTFNDFSGSIGLSYVPNRTHSFKVNIGRSFRYPSANELSANGLHHSAFRHEKGNSELGSEKSYQLDFGYEYKSIAVSVSATPFASYFSNYIFLEPSGKWSLLPHSGQVYEYRQAKALVAGGEITANYRFARHWEAGATVEYTHTLNLTDGYPLPFSPPTMVSTDVSYLGEGGGWLKNYVARLSTNRVFAQNRIARNEEVTPATLLFDVSAHAHWSIANMRFFTDLQVRNIFNAPFLNHLSFYRKLNAPEPGRNIQIILKIPF